MKTINKIKPIRCKFVENNNFIKTAVNKAQPAGFNVFITLFT